MSRLKAGRDRLITKPIVLTYSLVAILAIASAMLGIVTERSGQAATNPNLIGDLNNDNVVNIFDLSMLLSTFNTTNSTNDLNSDSVVNVFDLSILLSNFNHTYNSQNPTPTGVPGNWTLKFNDDFNGSSLDTGKWMPNWFGSTNTTLTKPVNDQYEESCYDPSLISVGGGNVTLGALTRSCTASNGHTYNYASSIINTYGKYTFTYGVAEARIWIPPGTGRSQNWPAFWSNGTGNWPTTGEIDTVEALGGQLCYHFHYSGGDPGGCSPATNTAGWHTFTSNWQPGSITYYYDGQQVGQITSGITGSPMYLIINYGLSSSLSPPIVTPSNMQVDYVRVWQ